MDKNWKFTRWIGSVLAPTAPFSRLDRGGAPQPMATAILRSGTLSFTGYTTLGGFVGSTTATSGMVEGGLPDARGWVEAPVATLTTRSELRDRDMRAALDAERFPTMRFELARVELLLDTDTGDDAIAVVLHGALTIHGVTRIVELPAMFSFDDESIHLASAFPLDVESYRITGLTRLFGLLRMHRQIEVRLDLQFTRLHATTPLRIE
jgi:hypothetical protein